MTAAYDCIIVGSGVAGLSTALALADRARVLVLTKDALEESNTHYAQGGIAVALGADDSASAHLRDTLAAGAGLVDAEAAFVLTGEGADRIRELEALGMPFDREGGRRGASIALGREAAHSAARIVHAGGDATGAVLERTLAGRVRASGVSVREQVLVTEILIEQDRVAGVAVLDCTNGHRERVSAPAVVLACGGAGRLYRYTTNPATATGDAVALAYRAGAEIADMEFIQFHPTALRLPHAPSFLISEAARGEGAILRDGDGAAFMSAYDPRAELAPRDVVARAIHARMAETGADHVFLDLRHLPPERVRARFPQIDRACRGFGLDITRDLLPVAPAAHYTMGGVRATVQGRTSVRGLFACGEAACTGVHGANRLASNSLLEGLVFAHRVADSVLAGVGPAAPAPEALSLPVAQLIEAGSPSLAAVQQLLWDRAGIVRDGDGLLQAREVLGAWQRALPPGRDRAGHELANLLLAGRLVVEAALARRESRGAHFRRDYPESTASGLRHTVFRPGAALDTRTVRSLVHAA